MVLNRSRFWALFLLGIVLLSCAVDARRDRDDVERGSDSDAKEKLERQSRSGGDRTGLNDLRRVKLGKRLAADGSFKSVPIVVTAADGSVRVVDVAISGVPVPSLRVRVLSEDDLGTGSGAGITSKGEDDDEDEDEDEFEFEDDDEDEEDSDSDDDEEEEKDKENEVTNALGKIDLDDVELETELQFAIKLVGFIEYSNGAESNSTAFELGVDKVVQYKTARSSVLTDASTWTISASTEIVGNVTILVVSATHSTGKVVLTAYVSDDDVAFAGHLLNQQDVKIDFKFDPEIFDTAVSASNYFAAVLKVQFSGEGCTEQDYSSEASKLLASGQVPEKNDWQCTANAVGGYLNWDRTLNAKLTSGEDVVVEIVSASYDAATFPLDQPSSPDAVVSKGDDDDDDDEDKSGSGSSGSGSSGSDKDDDEDEDEDEDEDDDGVDDDVEAGSKFSKDEEDELSLSKLDKGRVFVFSVTRVLENVDYFFWDPKTGVMDQKFSQSIEGESSSANHSTLSLFVSILVLAMLLL